MSFIEIVNQIRKDRKTRDAENVSKIQAALSPDQFASIFAYRKGNQIKAMRKNDVILRHFRKLQGKGTAPLTPPTWISQLQHLHRDQKPSRSENRLLVSSVLLLSDNDPRS